MSAGEAVGGRGDAAAAATRAVETAATIGAAAIEREHGVIFAAPRLFDDGNSWRGRANPVADGLPRTAIIALETACGVMSCRSLSACAIGRGRRRRSFR